MSFPRRDYDAVVIGAGPNGLAAAIAIAQAGHSVLLVEGQDAIGGGTRSAELTLPGFIHDVCAAVHPMAVWSPFFRTLPLAEHGLEWIHPPAPLAHPLGDAAVTIERSVEETASALGRDGERYKHLMAPLLNDWPKLEPLILKPLQLPAHPIAAARFGMEAVRSASGLATDTFRDAPGRALFAGLAGHSMLPLERPFSALFGLVIGVVAHAYGWPIARGGSQSIADALASYLRSLGGEIVTSTPVESLDDLPAAKAILCDVSPRQLLKLAGSRLPPGYRRKLEAFRYGPGACKLDWALDGPIPWKADACRRAGTVHVGGTLGEIAASERAPWENAAPDKPFVLLAQPTLFDPSRAPTGKHIAWAYCHVPNGSSVDMTEPIENQIERFAPGFRKLILKRSVRVAAEMESYNPNLIGGDSGGGAAIWQQLFFARRVSFTERPREESTYVRLRRRPVRACMDFADTWRHGRPCVTYSETKQLLRRILVVIFVIAVATYGIDYLWLRLRLDGSNQNSALGSVTLYDAVTLKNGKVEVFYDHPETETCVYSMLPHLGYTPCWYLQRKGQNIKLISLLTAPNRLESFRRNFNGG